MCIYLYIYIYMYIYMCVCVCVCVYKHANSRNCFIAWPVMLHSTVSYRSLIWPYICLATLQFVYRSFSCAEALAE